MGKDQESRATQTLYKKVVNTSEKSASHLTPVTETRKPLILFSSFFEHNLEN